MITINSNIASNETKCFAPDCNVTLQESKLLNKYLQWLFPFSGRDFVNVL